MNGFDIAPFTLPACPAGEYRFEEPRDITGLVLRFRTRVPRSLGVLYLRNRWPGVRYETYREVQNPAAFGWMPVDDQWNGEWRKAAIRVGVDGKTATVTFRPLRAEGLRVDDYDVSFRRTLGLRLSVPDPADIAAVRITTRSPAGRTTIRVLLDAGRKTRGTTLRLETYNAKVARITVVSGARAAGEAGLLKLAAKGTRCFLVTLEHMRPAHPYCGDDTHLTLGLDHDAFTICLQDLDRLGPVWNTAEGVYITRADDDTAFDAYRAAHAGRETTLRKVARTREQSFAGALYGQPRGHAPNYSLGCAHSPQRFWVEANGDILLHRQNLDFWGRKPEHARRFLAKGSSRLFFGLERWVACARYDGPTTAPIYTLIFRKDGVTVEETVLCIPLTRGIHTGELAYHEPTVALARFRFRNGLPGPARVSLPIRYSQDSTRSQNALANDPGMDDYLVPTSALDALEARDGRLWTDYQGTPVVRAAWAGDALQPTPTTPSASAPTEIRFEARLGADETREIVLKIPYVAPNQPGELEALESLDFERSRREVVEYWEKRSEGGSTLRTPVPHLDLVHATHLTHVLTADIAMPDDPELVNTSVGSSTYGNFLNEACMVIQDLDQRGLAREVERRLRVFVRYQGTATQPGNFTDFRGSFYGAGGWECGDYNQHHGWALWYLAEHYLLTRDRAYFSGVADAVVAGADWVFRQRKQTMGDLPHSRGWERGFLPAGSLEDVTEFCYWLSTNTLTWRGTDTAARALEHYGHAEAARVRRESDAFGADLRRGFETARRHAPLVKLQDGRWVPQYPSRLYRRGRDRGWIRALLEGSVYLLISGLYDADSRQAEWILNDLQDNLYHTPPYGYVQRDPDAALRHRGGFSIQPNLLAGLMPHLDRDEVEVYLWMFFNAWVACFREEIGGMIEHPMPELGFHNSTGFKTSDEANAVMWLRYLMVYSTPALLHLGRAIPRAWLGGSEDVSIQGVRTHYGLVSARWSAGPEGTLVLEARIGEPADAPRLLARFRHPHRTPMRSVTVNGENWTRYDARTEDVDLSGLGGELRVVVRY